ncbi:MAG TPA: hypothetical protein DCY88_32575 [Cyanobacteria bacterium UBA11372]|nr:hypothetical protein [Cyanobacteria bacterium UBA11372]
MSKYDQRGQRVDQQVNINFQASDRPDPTVLLDQGIKFLEAKSYQQAISAFKEVIEIEPSMSDAYYHLALALLKGRRPKILIRREIEAVDELLNSATVMGDSDGTVQLFRALVRDDYYNGNRIKNYPPPLVIDLVKTALSCKINIDKLRVLLSKLPMPDNQLYAALVAQIS